MKTLEIKLPELSDLKPLFQRVQNLFRTTLSLEDIFEILNDFSVTNCTKLMEDSLSVEQIEKLRTIYKFREELGVNFSSKLTAEIQSILEPYSDALEETVFKLRYDTAALNSEEFAKYQNGLSQVVSNLTGVMAQKVSAFFAMLEADPELKDADIVDDESETKVDKLLESKRISMFDPESGEIEKVLPILSWLETDENDID